MAGRAYDQTRQLLALSCLLNLHFCVRVLVHCRKSGKLRMAVVEVGEHEIHSPPKEKGVHTANRLGEGQIYAVELFGLIKGQRSHIGATSVQFPVKVQL